jgi:branched-chain amino acid transport system permease protein
VLLLLFLLARRIVNSPFGATLKAIRDNRLRAMAIGIRCTRACRGLHRRRRHGRRGRRAVHADLRLRLARRVRVPPLRRRDADAGDRRRGWLYGGVAGAIVFKLMQDCISQVTPQYWTFWLGLFLVVLVLVGRDRLSSPGPGREGATA